MNDSPGMGAEATARQLAGIGQFDAALRVLDQIMGDDPAFARAAMFKAAICHHLGRPEAALEPLARILALDPATAQALGNLALMLPGHLRTLSWRWHLRAVALSPQEVQILINAGTNALGQPGSKPAEISLWFKMAAVLDPARAEISGALGMIHTGQGDHGTAIPHYARAAQLLPQGHVPRFVLGSARQSAGFFEAAEADYAAAARLKWASHGAPTPPPATIPRLGLGWKPGFEAGWDVYGANLVKRLVERGDIEPIVVNPVIAGPDDRGPFAELFQRSLPIVAEGLSGDALPFTSLIGLGNDFTRFPCLGRARREVGVIFLEDTILSAAGRARAASFDLVIAGATWGAQVLANLGLPNVATVLQGIDPSLFNPEARAERGPRFRIFSGGKLEFRKGQDLVIRAFCKFNQRYPDSQLVLAWQSPWPAIARSITWAGVVESPPAIGPDHRLLLAPWLASFGLSGEQVEILDLLPNHQMPKVLANVDCAIFPNRCEGGTNLVAMEAMAAGVPVILSANTGHLDLIEGENCLSLIDQQPVIQPSAVTRPMGLDGWGESSVDEMVSHLETLYHDSARARAIGLAGAARLSRLTWPQQIDALVAALGPLS